VGVHVAVHEQVLQLGSGNPRGKPDGSFHRHAVSKRDVVRIGGFHRPGLAGAIGGALIIQRIGSRSAQLGISGLAALNAAAMSRMKLNPEQPFSASRERPRVVRRFVGAHERAARHFIFPRGRSGESRAANQRSISASWENAHAARLSRSP
jgi:hypothetical protein